MICLTLKELSIFPQNSFSDVKIKTLVSQPRILHVKSFWEAGQFHFRGILIKY